MSYCFAALIDELHLAETDEGWFYSFNRRGKNRDLNEQKIIKEPEGGNDMLTSLSLAVNHKCSLGALITPHNNEMHTQTHTLTKFTHMHIHHAR